MHVKVSTVRSVSTGPSPAIVAAICAAEILGLAGFSIVPALLPQFIEAWSLTNTQAGWLAGIVSAGYTLAVIPLVSLTDRRPARQLAVGVDRGLNTARYGGGGFEHGVGVVHVGGFGQGGFGGFHGGGGFGGGGHR